MTPAACAPALSITKTNLYTRPRTCEALEFSNFTIDSIAEIAPILRQVTSRTCDMTLGGIFMWIEYFRYQYCLIDNTLFIKGVAEDNPSVTAFSMPVGALPLQRAVAMVERYCHSHGLPIVFSAIPEDRLEEFFAVNPGFAMSELTDWADYLYDIDVLASLRGKKMNKKRNHVNRFIADNPDYTVEEIRPEILGEIENMIQRIADDDSPLARYERRQCVITLRSMALYGYHSAAIRPAPGAQICAFAVGEVIGDTLYTHIEKVDHDVAGAGEMINTTFARMMKERYPALRYVNREEDTGDEGLRRAKQSWHPLPLLRKYNVYL